MTWIVADSFDYYASAADIGRSVWDTATTSFTITTPANSRFGAPGQGFQPASNFGPATVWTKNIGSNEATLFAALAYFRTGVQSGTNPELYIQYRDGATAQCTIVFESSGAIVLKRGSETGTVVATYAAAFAPDTWTHFQIRVVIDPSAGTFTVRKNGSPTDSFAATALNTRSTANSYATVIAVGNGTFSVTGVYRGDDVLFYSGSGTPPNTWVGDVRAVCLQPSGDAAVQFTTLPASPNYQFGAQSGFAWTSTANVAGIMGPIKDSGGSPIAKSGHVVKVTVNSSGAMTGKARAAIYAGDGAGGLAGTLLGVSNEVTNPIAGANDFTFTPGQVPIVAGRNYYIAYLTDTNWVVNNGHVSMGTAYTKALSYASGFPASWGSIGTPTGANGMGGIINLGGNALTVSEAVANGDTDYALSATVSATDLYHVADLATTPVAILGVVSKGYVKKSDAGTRNGQLVVKSGATEVTTPDAALNTTYGYIWRADALDPNTGAAWTPAGIAAVQIGVRVTL